MLINLQKIQVASTLRCAIVASEGFSKIISHSSFPSLSHFDMLLVTSGDSIT